MKNIQLNQKAHIILPRFRPYTWDKPTGYFDLQDAEQFLDRWEVDKKALDPELYEKMKDSQERPMDRIGAFGSMFSEDVQKRFSRAILESLTPDFNMITQFNCPAFYRYYLLNTNSRGVLVLSEPPSQYMAYTDSNKFELSATPEINLETFVRQVNAYIEQNWKLPIETGVSSQ